MPVTSEHDEKAEERSEQGQGPMEVLESWTPVRSLENGVHEGNDVDEGIAHEEEEVKDFGNLVYGSKENGQLGDECGQKKTKRLTET